MLGSLKVAMVLVGALASGEVQAMQYRPRVVCGMTRYRKRGCLWPQLRVRRLFRMISANVLSDVVKALEE
jgi:hypothetical protein